jgi:hypothetical protein
MNAKQKRAVQRLAKALEACHSAGLMGGVYDGSFWAWPDDTKPDPRDGDNWKFFENVDAVGMKAETRMNLDGGAGV